MKKAVLIAAAAVLLAAALLIFVSLNGESGQRGISGSSESPLRKHRGKDKKKNAVFGEKTAFYIGFRPAPKHPG